MERVGNHPASPTCLTLRNLISTLNNKHQGAWKLMWMCISIPKCIIHALLNETRQTQHVKTRKQKEYNKQRKKQRHTHKHTSKQTHTHTHKQANKHTDTQARNEVTNKQTN